ncbi:MAG: hypothetical protein BHV58_04545 [Bifidobacteriales bacterium 56_10]|nr:MAG: hypothetical protein BHV58_04545 [Bifidobacteriales bacterium 56_10]
MKENRFYPEDLIRDIHACTPVYLERLLEIDREQLTEQEQLSYDILQQYFEANIAGDEIVSHAGWIAAEQDMRRHSNQSRYNCKLKHAMDLRDNRNDG